MNSTPPTEYTIPISFLPTGDIDYTHTSLSDLNKANQILAPTIQLVQSLLPTLDIWRFINWIFVSWYWIILSDFGQISPTTHKYWDTGIIYGWPIEVVNITAPATFHPITNNIFINETLYRIYSSFLRDLIPLAQASITLPEFIPLNDSNRLQPIKTGFLRTYICRERRWKGLLNAIISVLVADYALIVGSYSLLIWAGSWYQKRQMKNCIASCFEIYC